MLAVGVGTALNNSGSQDRLMKIAGPQMVKDADLNNIDSLNDIDVALVTDFDKLAALMRSLVLQLCSPSLTIQKLAQTPGSAQYAPAAGWDMTVTPAGSDRQRLPLDPAAGTPPTAPSARRSARTTTASPSSSGSRIPPEADSAATVAETLKTDYTAGRPGPNNDFICALRNEDGDVRTVIGDFADPAEPHLRHRPDRAGDRHLQGLQLLRLRPRDPPGEGERAHRGARRPRRQPEPG